MDIYEIINHRQSDRQYDPERPVEPEKIRCILEAALGLQCATVALHRSGRTRVAKPSGRCRGQPHIGHEPLHQTGSRAYPCRGGATQFHIGHRRAHQGQTISAARHRYRCRTHHPRRYCRRIGQLHTRLVRRESRA